MNIADLSPLISLGAIALSMFTLWFTVLRRGEVRSTHPSFIAVRYDFVSGRLPQAKVFVRALLFSTAKRGHVVETLLLRVSEGGRRAEFAFWGHGEKNHLIRGGGLFVPDSGVATDHHFNPIDAKTVFQFTGGIYTLELVAKLVGREKLLPLWSVQIELPSEAFGASIAKNTSVFYSWSPEQGRYVASIEKRDD
jgi:hypothetical protein